MEPNDIIDDFSKDEPQLVPASTRKRFANYIIDATGAYILMVMGMITFVDIDTVDEDSIPLNIGLMIFYAVYYILMESATGGKSLGKTLTRTRVTDYYGEPPTFGQIVQRSFSRLVPFEALSFLGSRPDGWHDRWSNTMVIDEGLSEY